MKITIQRSMLSEALKQVSKAVDTKVTLPILAGIKLEASGNELTLTASDSKTTIQTLIPDVEVETDGIIVLPAKFFVEIVSKLPKEEVEIEVADHQVFIKSGKTELDLVGLDAEEFPALPNLTEERTFMINGGNLKSLIRQTVFAVSTNENTPVLTGESWSLVDGKLKIIATDRHRLASMEMKIENANSVSITDLAIEGKALSELSKVLPDNKDVQISASDSQVLFKVENLKFFTRILDGTYPDTTRIINQNFVTEFNVNTKQITEALDRVYILSKEDKSNIAKLVINESGSIELSSSSGETSKVREQVEIGELKGDALKISFNSKYMLDALKVIDSENVHFGFVGDMSPIIITPLGESKAMHLVLPYKTR